MASAGILVAGGVTNSSTKEYDIKSSAVARSNKVYLLASQDKFNQIAIMTYCTLDKLTALITNAEPPKEIVEYMNEHGSEIYIAE
jgi:DeoR family myo-inositol catabolism operon transcriptional repressor